MSYDIGIYVKVEGEPIFAEIAAPEYSSPTYNLGKMFRACMDWVFAWECFEETEIGSAITKKITECIERDRNDSNE